MIRGAVVVTLLVSSIVACGGKSSPTAPPTTPSTPTTPTVTLYTVTGIVENMATRAPIAGAAVRVVDGPNAGRTSLTDGSGRYTLSGLTFAGFSVSVTAGGFFGQSKGVTLTAGTATTTVNFSLAPQNYSGSWSGTTSQSLPISFTVTGTTVAALTVDILVTLPRPPPIPPWTCPSSFRASGPVTFSGNSFEVPISSTFLIPVNDRPPFSTTARGTLGTSASETSASGSIASFVVSGVKCGPFGGIYFADCYQVPGATCTQPEKSWNATKQ